MSEPRFKVGDTAWWAKLESRSYQIPCPHCFGQKFLTVILGNGSQVTIDCECCRKGYEGPQGFCVVNQYDDKPTLAYICKVETSISNNQVVTEYGVNGTSNSYFCAKESDLFTSEEEAATCAKVKAKEESELEMKRFHDREHANRPWAWNVKYHRDCVKRAEQDLVYHRAKLDVAKQYKSKEQP